MNKNNYFIGLLLCIFMSITGCGGTSSSGSGTSSANSVKEVANSSFSGSLVDETDQPIIDAIVTLGGVEANDLTDRNGDFSISGIDNAECQTLAVLADGYEPFAAEIQTSLSELTLCEEQNTETRQVASITGQLKSASSVNNARFSGRNVQILRLDPPAVLRINSPINNATYAIPPACSSPVKTVSGMVSLQDKKTFLHDVILVIDTSGSTTRGTGTDLDEDGTTDTVLDVETEMARRIARTINDGGGRVGLIKFARAYDSDGDRVTEQTRLIGDVAAYSNLDEFEVQLETILNEGSDGGTDTGFAIELAVDSLLAAGSIALDTEDDQQGTVEAQEVTPYRSIILLSDGIPTLPSGSGLTQEAGDRQATLDSAQYAADNNIRIYPVVIEPEDATEHRLTTLPAVQAISGTPGQFLRVNLNSIESIGDLVERLPLSGVRDIAVHISSTGQQLVLNVDSTGRFETDIAVSESENTLEFSIDSGLSSQGLHESITFSVIDSSNASFADIADSSSVSDISNLNFAFGVRVKGSRLQNAITDYAPYARPIQSFRTIQAQSTEVSIRPIYKSAGYRSTHGYFIYDRNNPPTSGEAIIENLTEDNVLFYANVNNGDLTASSVPYLVSVPAGSEIGFFVIPDGTIAQAKAGTSKTPLFSLNELNPGSFVQALAFYNPYALDNNSLSQQGLLISFEDVPVATHSDRDFADVIFELTYVSPVYEQLGCQ